MRAASRPSSTVPQTPYVEPPPLWARPAKVCARCGVLRPGDAYYWQRQTGRSRPECIPCTRQRAAEVRAAKKLSAPDPQ
jgi:hypothetical protein